MSKYKPAVVPVDGESAGFPSKITASPAEFVVTVMTGDTRPNAVSRGDQSSRLRERETPKSMLFESAFWEGSIRMNIVSAFQGPS